jgi:uncharacterized protein YukE
MAAAALLSVAAGGCQPTGGPGSGRSGLANAIDPVQLNADLRLQLDSHLAEAVAAASEIASAVQDRRVRENCLRWKMRAQSTYLSILMEADPRLAFIYEWIDAVALRQYLAAPEGKDLFGPQQAVAVALAARQEAQVITLGKKNFSPQAIDDATDEVEAAGQRNAPQGPFGDRPPVPSGIEGDLLTIVRLPLLPIKTLEGASSTPQAIGRFTDTVQAFAAVVRYLPEVSRWQAEFLLLEMETAGPMAVVTKEMTHLETIVRQATDSLKTIPADVRQEFEKSLASVEKLRPAIAETLADARASAAEVGKTADGVKVAIQEGRVTAESAAKTAEQFQAAAKTFQSAAGEIRGVLGDYERLKAPDTQPTTSAPTVADYKAAAESFTAAAKEVRSLLGDLQQPVGEKAALRQAARDIQSAIDSLFWRALALAVAVFALAVVYRRLTRRRPHPKTPE